MESTKRKKVTIACAEGSSKTQQHFKDESDINRIVNKYAETGIITHIRQQPQQYGYATSQSFTEAMQIVAEAKSNFAELPSSVRTHFNNDPAQYLDAIEDPSRNAEFVKLGLIDPQPPEKQKEPEKAPSKPVEAKKTEATADTEPKA